MHFIKVKHDYRGLHILVFHGILLGVGLGIKTLVKVVNMVAVLRVIALGEEREVGLLCWSLVEGEKQKCIVLLLDRMVAEK